MLQVPAWVHFPIFPDFFSLPDLRTTVPSELLPLTVYDYRDIDQSE
jgi:hypothetical protein